MLRNAPFGMFGIMFHFRLVRRHNDLLQYRRSIDRCRLSLIAAARTSACPCSYREQWLRRLRPQEKHEPRSVCRRQFNV